MICYQFLFVIYYTVLSPYVVNMYVYCRNKIKLMKSNIISRNHTFLGTYIGDFHDFYGDFNGDFDGFRFIV